MANGHDDLGNFDQVATHRDLIALEKLLTQRFDDADKAVAAAFAASERGTTTALAATKEAISKAEAAQQRVNEGQNEFRATLKDQAATLMPRSETELLVKELRTQIASLIGSRREGVGISAGLVERVITIGIALLAIFLATH